MDNFVFHIHSSVIDFTLEYKYLFDFTNIILLRILLLFVLVNKVGISNITHQTLW